MAQYALAGPEEDVSQAFSIQEHCAACQALIPFNDLRYATCENGHVWGMYDLSCLFLKVFTPAPLTDRCSLTLEPINTLSARTCVGCGRKYMQLPPDAELSRSSLPDNEPKAPDGDELVEEVSTMNMDTEDWVGKEAAPHRLADVAKVVKTCIWCRSYTISAR